MKKQAAFFVILFCAIMLISCSLSRELEIIPSSATKEPEPIKTSPPQEEPVNLDEPRSELILYHSKEFDGVQYRLYGLMIEAEERMYDCGLALWTGKTLKYAANDDFLEYSELDFATLSGTPVVVVKHGYGTGAAVNTEGLYIYDIKHDEWVKAPDFYYHYPNEWSFFRINEKKYSIQMHGKSFAIDKHSFQSLLDAIEHPYDYDAEYEDTTDVALDISYRIEDEKLFIYYSTAALMNDMISCEKYIFTYRYDAEHSAFEIENVAIGEGTGYHAR